MNLNQEKSSIRVSTRLARFWPGPGTSTGRPSRFNRLEKPTKKRRSALSILFLTLLGIVSLIQPCNQEALAQDGLAAGSAARVAGTDGDGVRLREAASATAGTIQIVDENELVTIKSGPVKDKQGNSFYKITYNDKTGFAMTQYLIFAGKNPKATIKVIPAGNPAQVSGTDGDGANMRQQPSAGTPVLNVLPEKALLTVLGGPFADKQGNNFLRVDYKGQVGYISNAFLSQAPKNSITSGGGGFMKVSNTDGDPIRFRNGPGRTFEANGFVYEGQVLKLLGGAVKDDSGNKWYRLDRSGEVGFVDASFVAKTDSPAAPRPAQAAAPVAAPQPKAPAIQPPPGNGPLGERIVAYARQFLGWRYVWGGGSPAAGGFDCSGFVMWVMSQNGISGGHTVEDYLEIGKAVPGNALQPGDILIWANTYKPGPSHIGIYIGGGKFIHAESEATGVTIDSVNESYYASRFVTARRPGV